MTAQKILAIASLVTAISGLGLDQCVRFEIGFRGPDDRVLPGVLLRMYTQEIGDNDEVPWNESADFVRREEP